MPDALCYIASLVKISNKFDYISVGYVQNTGLKQRQIIPSAENIWNIKTGELEIRHKWIWPRYVSAEYLQYNENEGINGWAGEGGGKRNHENHQKMSWNSEELDFNI